uniref:Fibronectin type III domain-containing protein n=1 Tax=Geobacter metallireducens TaxID=28232 RepID=A0A831XLL0_GEOME
MTNQHSSSRRAAGGNPETFLRLALIVLLAVTAGCSGGTRDGSSSVESGNGNNGSTQVQPFTGPDPNLLLNVRERAAKADSYAITYGALTKADIDTLKTYPLVIVHPYNGNLTRDHIMWIKQGVDPTDSNDNPVVLCYISIGEDLRTFQLTDAQMRADPRFTGDGSGPSIDPRGPGERSLDIQDLKGTPTYGGFASYYVNDNAIRCPGDPVNVPDQNGNFLTRFVNAGDPLWYSTVKEMRMDVNTHTPPGLRELLTDNYGRGLGCDGVFLDTIDTAAPNKYTACSDTNHSSSEWTAKGFSDFIGRLRADFPTKIILQNRGLFFFDPREPHYQVSARGIIDIGFFESYYLDNDSQTSVSPYFPDNKYNSMPKIMAEANRPDGFKMLSLGYANGFGGAKPGMDVQTLQGTSTIGFDILMQDIQESHSVGFRHYITNATVDLVNSFVKNNKNMNDTTAPVWYSVFNANYEYPASPPEARPGIRKIDLNEDTVTISWDVALDMNRVSYALYYQTTPFNFSLPQPLANATRVVLTPGTGSGYNLVWQAPDPGLALQNVYPYESSVTLPGLQSGTTYYLLLRAFDSKGNEETNEIAWTCSNTTCSKL